MAVETMLNVRSTTGLRIVNIGRKPYSRAVLMVKLGPAAYDPSITAPKLVDRRNPSRQIGLERAAEARRHLV